MPAPKIAKAMPASSIRSATGPSWARMIAATGDRSALTAGTSSMATVRAIRNTRPATPAATTEATIARGTVRNGSLASSARLAAESKPTSVVSPMSIPAISPPPIAK